MEPEDLAAEWADALAGWAIPERILGAAPENPWCCVSGNFTVVGRELLDTASSAIEREVFPPGGTVLDVGCGGGRASLPLAPPAARLIGVDERDDMLDEYRRAASERGVDVELHRGRWPDVEPEVPVADVVVCHHVAYNVADVVPFLAGLTARASLAVVIEVTARHPQTPFAAAWRHFWGLERPVSPTADDLVALVEALGYRAETWRHLHPTSHPYDDPDRAKRAVRRRLCLPPSRDPEIANFLADHPLDWPSDLVTLRWPGRG